jgi:hypothetical protein
LHPAVSRALGSIVLVVAALLARQGGAQPAPAPLPPPAQPAPPAQTAPAAPVPGTLEYALVPLIGGDTDIGFGGGALGSVALLDPAYLPYRWKLEGAAFFTFKNDEGWSAPYQDAFLLLTINGLFGGRGRLEARPSFTRETNQRYYGIGDATPAPEDDIPARDFYTRTHPALTVRVRLAVKGPVYMTFGNLLTFNWINYGPASNIARDLAFGSPRLRSLLLVDRRHGLHLLEAGLVLDARDDEIAPLSGQYHQLKLRISPWGAGYFPYRYTQVNLTLRGYHSLRSDWLVAAARLVADVQLGAVPFYELSRYDEASALGGANGVRGIPSDRYYGKRKLFGNLEVRATLAHFSVGSSRYGLGVTGFLDGGRVWADVTSAPALDGTGLGLKYGVGGGLRLRKGQTFVLRADVAWSPDARPFGAYLLAGHMF